MSALLGSSKRTPLSSLELAIQQTIDTSWQAAVVLEDGNFKPEEQAVFNKKMCVFLFLFLLFLTFSFFACLLSVQ